MISRSTVGAGTATFDNCSFYSLAGYGSIDAYDNTWNFRNCVFDNVWRLGYKTTGQINLDYCNRNSIVTDSITATTNEVSGVPAYADAAGGDFTPASGLAIQVGSGQNLSIELDLWGADYDATTPSIGAYEYNTPGGGVGTMAIGSTFIVG